MWPCSTQRNPPSETPPVIQTKVGFNVLGLKTNLGTKQEACPLELLVGKRDAYFFSILMSRKQEEEQEPGEGTGTVYPTMVTLHGRSLKRTPTTNSLEYTHHPLTPVARVFSNKPRIDFPPASVGKMTLNTKQNKALFLTKLPLSCAC